MANMNNWKTFFDRHAVRYMEEPFVKATEAEVDFLIENLHFRKDHHILDMGCGTGRHTLELGRRGYHVTGVDLSSGMLDQARQVAQVEKLPTITFQQADATQYTTEEPFDRVYSVCEGSIGLIGTGSNPQEHDMSVLKNLHSALKPGGRMLITVLNAMRHIRLYQPEDVAAGMFDPVTLTEINTMTTGEGDEYVQVKVLERGFVIPELRFLLETIGFVVEHVGGGTAGRWSMRPLELDEYEIMAIASKPE